ncbi:MAG: DNA repair protein RadC [Alphaproteobacteria bacterium]|nr:DNA repair protein RadC [Alphaproteobacteria bacterium]
MGPEPETKPLSAQDQQGFDFDSAAITPAPPEAPTESEPEPDDTSPGKAKSPHAGHRARLKRRFMKVGAAGLEDYELLEIVLFGGIAQRDTKATAKAMIARFGSYEAAIAAPPDQLMEFPFVGDSAVTMIKAVEAAAVRLVRKQILNKPILSSSATLLAYCTAHMARAAKEEFRVLFLDTKNRLIEDVEMGRGTIDHAPVYVREVVQKALRLGAKAMILVHNHPSGDPTPSSADIAMTKEIVAAARPLGIAVHDHLVIGRNGHRSFRADGLL